jgi:hypothetical protein
MTVEVIGEIIYKDLWEIYRQKAGMGEFEYAIFHNDEFFASTSSMARAERIIRSIKKCERE